jgi:hypothetical protein
VSGHKNMRLEALLSLFLVADLTTGEILDRNEGQIVAPRLRRAVGARPATQAERARARRPPAPPGEGCPPRRTPRPWGALPRRLARPSAGNRAVDAIWLTNSTKIYPTASQVPYIRPRRERTAADGRPLHRPMRDSCL